MGGILFLHATFPEDLVQVRSLLAGGVSQVYCPQCRKVSPYDSAALCFFWPTRKGLFYLPGRLAEEHPDVVVKMRQTLEEVVANVNTDLKSNLEGFSEQESFSFDIILDAEKYRERLATAISTYVAPILADVFAAHEHDEDDPDKWFIENESRLDKAFFGGVWLLTQDVIPFYALIFPDEEEAEAIETKAAFSGLGPFYLKVISKNRDVNSQEVLTTIRGQLRDLIVLRILGLTRRLVAEGLLCEVEERLAEIIPKEAIDESTVELLAGVVPDYEENTDVPAVLKYAYDCMLAAVCDLAGLENPRCDDWAGWYVAFELHNRASASEKSVSGLTVPANFATRTITVEQFWDQLARRLNKAVTSKDASEYNRISELIADLGLEKDLQNWLARGYNINIENADPEVVAGVSEVIRGRVLQMPDANRPILELWLRTLAMRDIDWMVSFVQQLRHELLVGGHVSLSIWLGCRASELLNGFMLHPLAKEEVEGCIRELKQLSMWPPEEVHDHIDLLTEEGNTLRYLGERSAALERYELCRQMLPGDLNQANVRVNERNRAIVLREMGHVGESLGILLSLLPYTRTTEKANVLQSLACCYIALGQFREATETLTQASVELPEGSMVSSERLILLINLAFSFRKQRDFDMALQTAYDAFKIAHQEHQLWLVGIAAGLAADAAEELLEDEAEWVEVTDLAINILKETVSSTDKLRPSSIWDISIRALLAERLEAKGNIDEARQVIEQALNLYSQENYQELWVLWAKLSGYAHIQGQPALARSHLLSAQQSAIRAITHIEPDGDPFSLMMDKDRLQRVMAEQFLTAYRKSEIEALDLRAVADFQASVVLSNRLSLRWSLNEHSDVRAASTLENANYSEIQLRELADGLSHTEQKLAVVQAFRATSGIYLLLTNISDSGLESKLLPWVADELTVRKLINQTSFKLTMWSPAQQHDPLQHLPSWTDFSNAFLNAITEHVSSGTSVCIIPGPLSGIPFQLILGESFPLNFVPSLAVAQLLHRRRLDLPGGIRWRPHQVHDFIVWRFGEQPSIIEQFQLGASSLERDLDALGVGYTSTQGIEGTREALIQALQKAECVRLSCHGRARIDDMRFELLVADDQLPPTDATSLDSEPGQRFLVDWQTISELHNCPPLVFSAACASGMAISLRGGERVGLERPLFRGGTLAYVAPQWPVPVAHIQPLINRIIRAYNANADQNLTDTVFGEINAAVKEGVPSWVARSVAIHGDWL
ncbi:MAG TPA: CHAT domain-containing protein [Chloroflexia bacterium]|jgi:tetratricopeptide (TPR) repeat protein